MERSEELRGSLSSLTETFGTPQLGPAFADTIAAEPGVLLVGTEPGGIGPGRGRLGRGAGDRGRPQPGAVK